METPRKLTTDDIIIAAQAVQAIVPNPECVIVGSMALLVVLEENSKLAVSVDIDIVPSKTPVSPEKRKEFVDQLGEGSAFEREHGFYVEGMGSDILQIMPPGWEERANVIDLGEFKIRCISPYDVACNKLFAGREKDYGHLLTMIEEKLIDLGALREFTEKIPSHYVVMEKKVSESLKVLEGLHANAANC